MKRIIFLVGGALLCCNVLLGMDNKRKASAPTEPQAEKKRVVAKGSATQSTSSRRAVAAQSSSLPVSSQDIQASGQHSQPTPSRVVRPTLNQQLFSFCSRRSIQPLLDLLKQGASANSMGTRGVSALHKACILGDIQVVKIFLQNSARVNQQDERGFTPLFNASYCGHGEVVAELLEVDGIDVNLRGDFDLTPLHLASYNGHINVVKQLVAAKGDSTIKGVIPAEDWTIKGGINVKQTAEDMARDRGHNEVANYLQQVREAREQANASTGLAALASAVDDNDNDK